MGAPPYARYVALGDSSTEGVDDPDGRGGYRGWADRLADTVARSQGSLLYANLAIRGRRTRQILDQQLAPALAMRPDLATVFSGTNDVVARHFSVTEVAGDMETIQRELVAQGATVLTFTLPDLEPVMPAARGVTPRLHALNDALREVAARTGARLVDFARHPVTTDARLWSRDRLHGNSAGHARIAAALAHALEIPGTDASWSEPLPPRRNPTLPERLGADLVWAGRYLLPWLWRHARGRSSGDGRQCKRPALEPVAGPADPVRDPVLDPARIG